jgi:hypothetical protein
MNNRFLSKILIIFILGIIVGGGILGWGIAVGEEISNPLNAQPSDLIKSLFQWIWFLVIAAIPIFGWFLVSCLLILLGFKILKIKEIPRSKIVFFLFVIFLLSLFVTPAVNKIFENVLSKPLIIFVNVFIYFGISFLLLKYYFLLSRKKLWQFLLYLIVINITFSLVIFVFQYWGMPKGEVEMPKEEKEGIETPEGVTPKNEINNWNTYRNEEYGFEVKYPSEFVVSSEGPNAAQRAIDEGKQISGTVQPSYDTIIFADNHNELGRIEIFHKYEQHIFEENYKDKGYLKWHLYLYGPCDIRWEFKPESFNFKYIGNNSVLTVRGSDKEGKIQNCYYLKNANENLIVFSNKEYKPEIFNTILSTLKIYWETKTCDEFLQECAKEGGNLCSPCGCTNCCSELVARDVTHPYRNKNDEIVCLENMTAYICVKCGDGICGKGEDWCICPEDCSKPNPEDLELGF